MKKTEYDEECMSNTICTKYDDNLFSQACKKMNKKKQEIN